jgi:hypothetical protein
VRVGDSSKVFCVTVRDSSKVFCVTVGDSSKVFCVAQWERAANVFYLVIK